MVEHMQNKVYDKVFRFDFIKKHVDLTLLLLVTVWLSNIMPRNIMKTTYFWHELSELLKHYQYSPLRLEAKA